MKALFRTDSSHSIGGGHVMRCLTLANGLADHGWRCDFAVGAGSCDAVAALATSRHGVLEFDADAVDDEIESIRERFGSADWAVVDHYGLDGQYETRLRTIADRIAVIDDLADRHHDCDLVLDQTFGRKEHDYDGLVPAGARRLIGSRYTLLRPEFAQLRDEALARRAACEEIRTILVCMGATDAAGILKDILRSLDILDPSISIDVALGSVDADAAGLTAIAATLARDVRFHGFEADMAGLMLRADLGIMSAGGTTWERMCVGLVTLAVIVADHQRKIAHDLAADGYQIVAGAEKVPTRDEIAAIVDRLHPSKGAYRRIASRCASLIDGSGCDLVIDEMQHA